MKQEIIQHINQLVREGEPFLFVINYHGDKVYIKKLSEIDTHECLYDFDGKTNTKDLSPNGLPSKISWKAMAPSFSEYANSFDIVKRNIMAGNSYLTNLTCQVLIECNLSLEDVFFYSQGKYKLWMNNSDDRFGKFVCFSPKTFVKIKNGNAMALPYHQERMKRTMQHFFPGKNIPCLEEVIASTHDMDFYKARVVYGEKGIEDIQYALYSMKEIHTLKIVRDDDIDYSFKSTDRTDLNWLAATKGNCDEIIIIKNGLVTDTSFTNIAIYKDGKWLTPKHPLLLGTKRAALLENGIIQETDITVDDLMKAEKVSLFNAMIDFGEREVMTQDIFLHKNIINILLGFFILNYSCYLCRKFAALGN